jgi:phage terminase large subunit-like protein
VAVIRLPHHANAQDFDPLSIEDDLNLEFVEHPQGGTKRGKPTEAMKLAANSADREPQGLWMPGSVRQLEEMMLEGRIRLQKSPVLISAIMSAVIETDRWDNYWLSKQRATNKIDAAVALCMAIGATMASDTGATIDDWLKSLAA